MIRLLISFSLILLPLTSISTEFNGCQIYTEKYNKIYKLPNKLLTSISLVESGMVKGNEINPWPWALNVNGKSQYFDNKKDTMSFLKESLKNSRNIVSNLIPLCRSCHEDSEVINKQKDKLKEIVQRRMTNAKTS